MRYISRTEHHKGVAVPSSLTESFVLKSTNDSLQGNRCSLKCYRLRNIMRHQAQCSQSKNKELNRIM